MQKWEYYWFRSEIDGLFDFKDKKGRAKSISTDDYLVQLGEEGWELTAVSKSLAGSHSTSNTEHTFFFKRPK